MTTRRGVIALIVALSGLILAFALMDDVAPRWARPARLDLWALPAELEDASAEAKLQTALDAKLAITAGESEVSRHIAGKVISGSITLAEAVDELEPMLRSRVGFECAWSHDSVPPPTFRHRVARHVIACAEYQLRSDSLRWATVSAQLNADYAVLK